MGAGRGGPFRRRVACTVNCLLYRRHSKRLSQKIVVRLVHNLDARRWCEGGCECSCLYTGRGEQRTRLRVGRVMGGSPRADRKSLPLPATKHSNLINIISWEIEAFVLTQANAELQMRIV